MANRQSKNTASPNVGNSIYNSPYKLMTWEWLKNGMPISAVKEALDEKGFNVTLPVIYNFRDIMQDYESQYGEVSSGEFTGSYMEDEDDEDNPSNPPFPDMSSPENVPESLRIKNDGEVLDLLILKFAHQLKTGTMNVTPAVALKAIDMKKNMLGAKYRGQTIWSLMESQLQIDKLLEVMNRHVTHEQFEAIVAEMEQSGVVTTQRPKPLGSSMLNLDSVLNSEDKSTVDPIKSLDNETKIF